MSREEAITVATAAVEKSSSEERLSVARNIVNGLYELAGLDVHVRQALNDDADEFVVRCLERLR